MTKKLALFGAIAAVILTSAAFAESPNDDQSTAAKLDEVTLQQVAPMVPILVDYADEPSRTGGGSSGYNDHLNKRY